MSSVKYLIFFFILFCHPAYSEEFISYNKFEDVQKTLRQFEDKEFDKYLINVSRFSFEDHCSAISLLFFDYRNNFLKSEACSEAYLKLKKEYNKQWLDGLIKLKGAEYIKKHIESLKRLILNINNKHSRDFCVESEKNLIFSEVHYVLAIKNFLDLYKSYVASVPKDKRKTYSENIVLADTIAKSINSPLYSKLGGNVGAYLNITNNIHLESDIVEYIVNHPSLLKPFNFVKAIKSLHAVAQEKTDKKRP